MIIRERKITAEEVVKSFIERCKEVNGLLNAIVEERYEDALKEAQEVDKMLKDENLTAEHLEKKMPLLGVPFTTKESNEAKGKFIEKQIAVNKLCNVLLKNS